MLVFEEAEKYEKSLEEDFKKKCGIYYTPEPIVRYIVDSTIGKHDIMKNPMPRILDMSCGCGNFIVTAYETLKEMMINSSYELCKKYKTDIFRKENIPKYIFENCIFGCDTDENAIRILKKMVADEIGNESNTNIFNDDGLFKKWKDKFDYVIGNPPYIGHKLLSKDYKKVVIDSYSSVYRDKSDLYFCFYKRAIDCLKKDGIVSMITPRYFLESMSATHLRKYLKENTEIHEIVDFLGYSSFGEIGVSACIVTFKIKSDKKIKTLIYRKKDDSYRKKDNRVYISLHDSLSDISKFEKIKIDYSELSNNWIIANQNDMKLYKAIESMNSPRLYEISESFQGIITGCDKAFVVGNDDDRLDYADKNILKKWIKSREIDSYNINGGNRTLIYSNDIKSDNCYEISEFIRPYKNKLEKRRECVNGIRKWYELQWGRDKCNFERKKIMYPYKSRNNRFALDNNNCYSSADVYSMCIKPEYEEIYSYEYLVGVLNSSVYDKYYKINAKKMSRGVYDYYPNKVMEMKIFKDSNYDKIESLSKEILKMYKILDKCIDTDKIKISSLIEKNKEKIDFLVENSVSKIF